MRNKEDILITKIANIAIGGLGCLILGPLVAVILFSWVFGFERIQEPFMNPDDYAAEYGEKLNYP